MSITGQCRCSAVTYHLDLPALPAVYACHCLHCQRWSGSAFGLHALVPEAALSITGEVVEYLHEHEGQQSRQLICARCHTRICNSTTAAPGMRVLRAGTLDGGERLVPAAHIWISRKQPWLELPEGVPGWERSPEPMAFVRAVFGG